MTWLTAVRGDTAVFNIALLDQDDAPLDLTTATLRFTVKRSANDDDVDAILSKDSTPGGGIVIDADPATGLATLTLEPADTDGIDVTVRGYRNLRWDLQVEDDGTIRTPLSGRFEIAGDVTREAGGS